MVLVVVVYGWGRAAGEWMVPALEDNESLIEMEVRDQQMELTGAIDIGEAL